jgi:thioredoxin-related protein
MKLTYKVLFIISLCAALIHWPLAQADELPNVQDLRVEAALSKQKQTPVLVLFKSDYCPYCITVLDEFLLPMQRKREYDSKVILRQIEINKKTKLLDFNGKATTGIDFANQHKVMAIPTVMLFDSEGRELTRITGLLTIDFYLAYLNTAIEESQAKIKAQKP